MNLKVIIRYYQLLCSYNVVIHTRTERETQMKEIIFKDNGRHIICNKLHFPITYIIAYFLT